MSYAKIVAKKIRMCARFGHLTDVASGQRWVRVPWRGHYYCVRCGELLPLPKRGAP